jgi:hypothetical protein
MMSIVESARVDGRRPRFSSGEPACGRSPPKAYLSHGNTGWGVSGGVTYRMGSMSPSGLNAAFALLIWA